MKHKFSSTNLLFRELTLEDISPEYIGWLNNSEINQYLEVRHFVHTHDTVRDFIEEVNLSKTEYLFGIFTLKEKKHIGNIKIGNINLIHEVGEVSLFIGDKDFWGHGFGKEAISTVTSFGFDRLNLKKIEAGAYQDNKASINSFLKCNYIIEGMNREHFISDNKRTGLIRLGILESERC